MSIRSLFAGLLKRSQTTIGSGYVAAAPNLSGTYITPQTAIGLTAVFAAINVISRDVATLPLNVYRKLPSGGREIAEDHPVQDLLRWEPNEDNDAFRLRRDSMGHVLGWGNGYQEIARDRRGYPSGLHIVHPAKTLAKRSSTGRLYYELDGDESKRLLPENCLHFAGLGFNGITGYTPLTVARQSIGLTMAAEQFGASFFGNGAVARGILKVAKKLGTQAQTNLRNSINQIHQGSQSAHQLMILEEGMDWINNQINPDDAQFLATRQFGVIEIARLYSVPPHKLGDYSQAHLTNVEEANLDYIVTTLAGWLVMLESQYNLKLLSRADRQKFIILHDMSALLRGNMAARITYYRGMREMGCLSANDILMAEGRNPLPEGKGGDKHLVQAQYQPLEKAGEPPIDRKAKTRSSRRRPKKRYNPNHGEDGKFTSGHGGGDELEGRIRRSYEHADRLKDDPEAIDKLAREFPHVADDGWREQAREDYDELLKDQAEEVKEQSRDQKQALKDFDRGQAQEARDHERELRDEERELKRDQAAEAKDLDRRQKTEVKEQEKDHAENLEDHANDPSDPRSRDEYVAELNQERNELLVAHRDEREALWAEHAEQTRELQEDHASRRDDFKKTQADDRERFVDEQENEREELLETHAEARREFISDKALELIDLQAELEEDDQ